MKKTGEEILADVFKDRFGSKAIAIVKDSFAKQKIVGFETLDPKEQADIGQALIETVFKELLDKEIIEAMKIRFVILFAINNAIDTMKTMMQTKVNLEIRPILEEPVSKLKTISKQILKNDTSKFCFECSGLLIGQLVLAIETDDAVIYSKLLMKYMLGVESDNNELDNEKISTIYEFFNVLFPGILDIIGASFDNSLYFTPLFFEDFQSRFMTEDEIKKPNSIHSSSLTTTIADTKTIAKLYFFKE